MLLSWTIFINPNVDLVFGTNSTVGVNVENLQLSGFLTFYPLLFFSFSIFFYIFGYIRNNSFYKIASLYFLLVSLSFLSLPIILAAFAIPSFLTFYLSPALILFLPIFLVDSLFFEPKQKLKLYLLLFLLNLAASIVSGIGISDVIVDIVASFLNLGIFYFQLKRR